MIALLSCSINLLGSRANTISSTGGLDVVNDSDSVLVSYDDLRIVNSKLVELKYVKEINTKLYDVIHNDSIIIDTQKVQIDKANKQNNKIKKQRNIALGGSVLVVLLYLISLL